MFQMPPQYYIILIFAESIINSVKKVPGIDHSKAPLKEIVKNLFDAKLTPLSSILKSCRSAGPKRPRTKCFKCLKS